MLLRISAAGLRKVLVSGSGRRQIDLTYLSLILERTASKFHNGGCATSSMVMVMPFIVWQHKMRVYRSYASKGRLMDPSEVKTADAVDRFLRKRIPQMERVLAGQGLSALRGKREGAVKFWYSVGVELRKLWAELQDKFKAPDTELDLFLWELDLFLCSKSRRRRSQHAHSSTAPTSWLNSQKKPSNASAPGQSGLDCWTTRGRRRTRE